MQAVLVLALAATLGALLGILGDRYIAQRRASDAAPGLERMAPPRGGMMPGLRYGEALAARLDLSAQQRERIETILVEDRVRARELTEEFQPQFRALADQTRQRVEAVLTTEQLEQLRAMRQQRMRRRGEERPGGFDETAPPRRPGTPRTGAPSTDTVRQP
jgi:hypothetical protein